MIERKGKSVIRKTNENKIKLCDGQKTKIHVKLTKGRTIQRRLMMKSVLGLGSVESTVDD